MGVGGAAVPDAVDDNRILLLASVCAHPQPARGALRKARHANAARPGLGGLAARGGARAARAAPQAQDKPATNPHGVKCATRPIYISVFHESIIDLSVNIVISRFRSKICLKSSIALVFVQTGARALRSAIKNSADFEDSGVR